MAEEIKKNVPRIRFKGFDGEWMDKTLGEITSKIGSGKTPKGGDSTYVSSGIALLRSQNINNDLVSFEDVAFITPETDEEMENSQVFNGDVLLNITGASIGRSAVFRSNEHANVNQHVCIIRLVDGFGPGFVQLHLTSSRGQKIIESSQAGGGREGLNFQQIGRMAFRFPEAADESEQTKIGAYFQELDELIGLHQRKHEKLMTLKKAMLKKMFPAPGATTPEIRFKGFDKPWEEKTFGEIFDFERPDKYIVSSAHYDTDFSTPVLTANKAFILGYTSEIRTFDEPSLIFDDFTLECKYVDFPYMVKSSALKILTIRHETIDDLQFAFNLLQTTKIEIMGHARHYIGVVQPTTVFSPVLEEQQKIGTYFRQLDELITLHETQLEKLRQFKAACLEKMFV